MNDLNQGTVLSGRYRLVRPLASGGMARVYLAEDLRLQRQVAVKIVHSHLIEDPSFLERFDREAVMAARVNHPNLVNVFDQGVDGSNHYLVMEYVQGETLRQVMEQFGALPSNRAIEVVSAILSGLSAAHSAGIIHRDIKPENVLLADDGRIKLSDFGLARPSNDATQTEAILGTAAYLSPELVTRGQTDQRSDIYAVGILLYELVTGKQPFTGELASQVAAQHATLSVQRPSIVKPDVPPFVDQLVLAATQKDPSRRPKDAREFLQLIAGNEIPANSAPQSTQRIEASALNNQTVRLDSNTNLTEQFIPEATESETNPLQDFAPRRIFVKWSIATVLAILLGVSIGWWFGAGPGALRAIPECSGRPQATVEHTLQSLGLNTKVSHEFSSSISQGLVTHTSPGSGMLVAPGTEVTIFVSDGPELRAVPNLLNLDVATATERIISSGFTFGGATAFFNDSPIGTVFSYDGSDGVAKPAGSSVSVKVSLGPIPAVVSIDLNTAKTVLKTAGLSIGRVTYQYSETVNQGMVVKLIPQSEPLGQNGTVNLVVSKGPENVTMPKVVGETIDAAKTLLESLGLKVVVDTNQLTSNWGIAKVKRVSVSAGTVIKKGSSVTIVSR